MVLGGTDRPERVGMQVWWRMMWAWNAYLMLSNTHSRRLKLWAFAIALLSSGAVWLLARAIRERRRRASAAWPAASGVVHSASVRQMTESLPGGYSVNIAYSYVAGIERYGGYAERSFRKEQDADAEARRLRDASVVVKYDPGNPELSLLT